jgi:hypothetical protein
MLRAKYKTKFLAFQGLILTISIVVLAGAVFLIIPVFKGTQPAKQLYSISGEALKYDDAGMVTDFFHSVSSNNGYVCLGTSESGSLQDGNYFDFLNNDAKILTRFSKLSGAGRTCGIYFPVFLNHAADLKGVKVIYLINPVYWGTNLCKPEFDYWTRYVDYSLARNALHDENAPPGVREIIKEYHSTINLPNQILYATMSVIRKFHAKFKIDLNFLTMPSNYTTALNFVPTKTTSSLYKNSGTIDAASADTLWNVHKDFLPHKRMSNIHPDNDFRYRELEAFIALCKQLDVDITFLICPSNEIFIQRYAPEALGAYQQTGTKIKALLSAHAADVIDATDIGLKPGTFIDNQHISSFGAYLIYQKIKTHLHEKETIQTK